MGNNQSNHPATMNRIVAKKRKADHGGDSRTVSYAQERPDLISRLPDCILGTIVSLLGIEEGVRTAILTHRWRHVWRSTPLNLDDPLYSVTDYSRRLQIISQILAAHPGPVRRLASNFSRFDDWFPLPMFDSLVELLLHFPLRFAHQALPASAFRFSSLRVLDIQSCIFPVGCSPAFPCLNYLSLRNVTITEELLQGMISNSPGIEAMVLDTKYGHRRVRLSLLRLRYLAVLARWFVRRMEEIELDDLVVEDAASLERLLLHHATYGPSARITGTTKLKMLGYLGTGFPIIKLGNSIFKGMVPISLVEQFSTVRILALAMPNTNLKVVIGYLRCFPCLEKIHIKLFDGVWTTLVRAGLYDPFTPVECLDRSLKTIVLQPYPGRKPHVEFAKFFVERARVLELMKFANCRGSTTRWIRTQRRRLNIENRASRCAQFSFVLEWDHSSTFWMSESFSRDDPF